MFFGFVGVYGMATLAARALLKQDTIGLNNSQWTIIPDMIMGSYFAHNLYAQYQHNKSQEKQINVNIYGVDKIIDVSPQYGDLYSIYNLLNFISCTMHIGSVMLSLPTIFELSQHINVAGSVYKLLSLDSSYNDLTFTYHETGEIIPHEIIIRSK